MVNKLPPVKGLNIRIPIGGEGVYESGVYI